MPHAVHIHSSRPSCIRVIVFDAPLSSREVPPSVFVSVPLGDPEAELTLLSLSLIGQLVFQLLAQRLHQEAAEADGA
jgi:hypothetical protein